ncbi:O-antigen ligase family protein, partial [Serratia bockelmannii]
HLFNSFLLDSSEGHLFVIIAALLAGRSLNAQQRQTEGASPSQR